MPIDERKAALAKLLRRVDLRHSFQRALQRRRGVVYRHACALGSEGIVSKRLGSPYRGGRADSG